MERKLLERKIDYLRWLIKRYLEEASANNVISVDLAKDIARTVNKELTTEISDERSLDDAINRILKLHPQLKEEIDTILQESFWEEKRQAVDYYILPLINQGKSEEALLLLREIMNQTDSLANIYNSSFAKGE